MAEQLTFTTMGGETVSVKPRGKHYVQPRGYAYHPGTGPEGETCGSCRFDEKHRRWHKCGHEYAARKHTGGRGSDILAGTAACKYWEAATQSTAVLGGPGDCYRYELRRVWDRRHPLLVVCMLNPSTADHEKNDPTILALIHFANLWGYGGILVVNLFAYRASSPAVMMAFDASIGPENHHWIEQAFVYAKANGGKLLAAWGNDGGFEGRDEWFCSRARTHGLDLICLGTTNSWKPKHPMARGKHRVPRDQQPIMWREARPS